MRPHPKNPRRHPDQAIAKLTRSLAEYGFTNPILVSADGWVLAGHARLKAAKAAGLSEVPVIRLPLEGLKAEAYMVADNRLQEETDWDPALLTDLLVGLGDSALDLEMTGLDTDEVAELRTGSKPWDIDDLLQELNLAEAVERPIWAVVRTAAENKELVERAMAILEQGGLRVERSYGG